MLNLNIGITDSNICLNKCSVFEVTFPVDEEYANNSKIEWNPWGYTFSFVYDFNSGKLLFCDRYTTIDVDENIKDAISALKPYNGGMEWRTMGLPMEWRIQYRNDFNSWKPVEYIPFEHNPNRGKWVTPTHDEHENDMIFPLDEYEPIYKSDDSEYIEGANNEIDIFRKYICGMDGHKSIFDVSCAVVKALQKIS